MIAAVHFLALLSPGPDFFLVARTSLSAGWRIASGTCVGIALANGLFIVAAFAGTATLRPDSTAFLGLQLAGCAYLLYLGVLFIRHAGHGALAAPVVRSSAVAPAPAAHAWGRAALMGFLSGLFNPKNALFYASLAAMLEGPAASAGWKTLYGLWMFGVVLLWDLLIALTIGRQAVLQRFSRALPWLERLSGVALLLLAMGVLGAMAWPT